MQRLTRAFAAVLGVLVAVRVTAPFAGTLIAPLGALLLCMLLLVWLFGEQRPR